MTSPRRFAMMYVAPILALVLVCIVAALSSPVPRQPCPTSWEPGSAAVASKDTHGNAVLYNGFVCVKVSSGLGARVVWASADFEGRGQYGKNVLGPDGIQTLHFPKSAFSTLTVESSGGNGTEAVVSIVDKTHSGSAQETWTVKLGKLSRSFELRTAGFVAADPNSPAPCRLWDMSPASIYAWYDDAQDGESVVQMKFATVEKSRFSSKTRLKRVYALGANNHQQHPSRLETGAVGNRSIDILLEGGRQVTTLGSGIHGVKLFEHLGGAATLAPETTVWDEWAAALSSVRNRSSLTWDYSAHVGVNSYDFPVAELGTGPNLPTDDLRAFMTGIYASPAGVLSTHMNAVVPGIKVAQMATTISMPFHGYEGNYNFFDPDDYIATAALLWSNDPFLQRQVRSVLERSGQFLKNESGLLPHHFVKDVPVYAALSDEVQTGPNLFWILSCLNYAKTSGDKAWLENYMPTIRHAAKFLDNLIDPQVGLAKVPGSLMIDIFLRSNFTTDTNAMLVGFLSEFAAAEEWIGDHARASDLRALSETIKTSLRTYLWDSIDNDHFITQWNYPVNTTRDFVDYDANLIALAHGVVSQEDGEKVLARIDKGPCMTTTASWVSEKYYGKNETAHGNIGDSSCAMARIAWFDALARKRYGGVQVFNERILGLIKKELFSSTWMHERLRCDGSQEVFRTFGYFEYPSTAAMLIKAVRYGIKVEYGKVVVDPFGPRKFDYDIHGIRVHYDPDEVTELFIDGTGPRQFTIAGLLENTPYNVQVSAFNYNFSSTPDGVISFDAQAGEPVKVTRLHLIEIPQALEA